MGSCFGSDVLGEESLEYTSLTITGLKDPSAPGQDSKRTVGVTEVK